MHIALHVSTHHIRTWLPVLVHRLRTELAADVSVIIHNGGSPMPAVLESLIALERITLRSSASWCAPLPPTDLPLARGNTPPDALHLDLTGDRESRGLRPLFNGQPSQMALYSVLLEGIPLHITLEDRNARIRASGTPSFENACGFGEALDVAYATLITLCLKALSHPVSAPHTDTHASPPVCYTPQQALRYAGKRIVYQATRRIYKLCCHSPHWHVGWRWHNGNSGGVWQDRTLGGTPWQILPDDGLRFYADPFAVTWEGQTALFVEELAHHNGKGVISAVSFEQQRPVGTPQVVLEEPWHLSYPCVFSHEGTLYMIPESSSHNEIALYRCLSFPQKWEKCAVLIAPIHASDTTIVTHGGLYWLFCTTPMGIGHGQSPFGLPPCLSSSDNLMLFYADDLFGEWNPHPLNPVVVDAAQARPAGHFYTHAGKLYRPAQDCTRGYGTGLALCTLETLNREHYAQSVETVLRPDVSWHGRKLHTLNRAGKLEVIDGSAHNPKYRSWLRH